MRNNVRKYGILIAILILAITLVWQVAKVFLHVLLRPYVEQIVAEHDIQVDAVLEYLSLLLITLAVICLMTIVYWVGFASGQLAAPSGYVRRRYWGELWPYRLPFKPEYESRPPFFTVLSYETKGGEIINSFSMHLALTLQKRSACTISGVWHKLPARTTPGSRFQVFDPKDGLLLPEASAWIILASGYSIGHKSYSPPDPKVIKENTEDTYRGHAKVGMWIEDQTGSKKTTIPLGQSAQIQLVVNSDRYLPVYYLLEIVNDSEKPCVKILKEGLVPYAKSR